MVLSSLHYNIMLKKGDQFFYGDLHKHSCTHTHTHTHTHTLILEVAVKECLTPEQLVLMYLLQGNNLSTSASLTTAKTAHEDSMPLARAFLDLCESQREAYWLFVRFRKMIDAIDRNLLVSDTTLVLLFTCIRMCIVVS